MKLPQFTLIATIFAVLLTGCGGGGSSKSNSVPSSTSSSSNLPLSSLSSSSAASSTPVTTQLTIRGMAVADGLAGGDVSFSIGSQLYKTKVDDKNQYQITLDIEDEAATKPFTATVEGTATNSWIVLAAIFPSPDKLKILAGVDGILDATEYLGVNFSPQTTTEYTYTLGSRRFPTTDALRQQALVTMDAVDRLRHAAYVQSVLDDNTKLPARFPHTLAMYAETEYVNSQINILKAYGDVLEDEMSTLLDDANQTRVSDQPLAGKFVVSGEGFYYLLDFNSDGKGHLMTSNSPGGAIWAEDGKYREGTFTWVRNGSQVKVTLDTPVNFGKPYFPPEECVGLSDSGTANCDVKLNSLLLSLVAENEVSKIANITLTTSLVNIDTQRAQESEVENHLATLLDRSRLDVITPTELHGFEWYTNTSRYVFNSNGTATQTNLVLNTEKNINWQLNEGLISLDGETKLLLPLYSTEYGFVVIEQREKSNQLYINNALGKTLLVKRQAIEKQPSEWVGRWKRLLGDSSTLISTYDFYSDGGYRDGYETKAYGSWRVVDGSRVSSLLGGTWRTDHDVLAVHSGKYLIKSCYGSDSVDFIPAGCLVENFIIDNAHYDGKVFWEVWSNPYFQEEGTLREWRFAGHDLYRSGDGLRTYQRIASNLLFNKETKSILEMRSSSIDSIELCEYTLLSSCEAGTVHRLNRGMEIAVNNPSGNGRVQYSASTPILSVFGKGSMLLPKSTAISLKVIPDSGYTITLGDISGCDGTLNGTSYDIPARQSDCEITLQFTAAP